MDEKTQPVERVVEALTPVLAAELDRVVRETREALEQQLEQRLEAVVRESEQAAAAAETRLAETVQQVREEARREFQAEVDRQVADRVESAVAQIQMEAAEQRAKLEAALRQWQTFAEADRQLYEASSQPEILARFLRMAEAFAEGVAVYVSKPDGLALWKSKGVDAFPDIISKDTTDPESYFRTICVRGKTVGAVCAHPGFRPDALDFLSAALERAIEVFGLRLHSTAAKAAAGI